MKFFGNERKDYHASAMREFPLVQRILYYVAAGVVRVYLGILWPWTIEGKERLFEKKDGRGHIVVMNHVSMIEPVILDLEYLYNHERIRPLYKSAFDKVRLLGWFLGVAGAIPVARGEADIRPLRYATRALNRGESVLIYPEGTRIKSDDEPVEIHGGFAVLARMAHADILPVAIVGARDVTPRGKHIGRPGRVYLKVGEAIDLADVTGANKKEQLVNLENYAMQKVFELRDDLRKKHPGKM